MNQTGNARRPLSQPTFPNNYRPDRAQCSSSRTFEAVGGGGDATKALNVFSLAASNQRLPTLLVMFHLWTTTANYSVGYLLKSPHGSELFCASRAVGCGRLVPTPTSVCCFSSSSDRAEHSSVALFQLAKDSTATAQHDHPFDTLMRSR